MSRPFEKDSDLPRVNRGVGEGFEGPGGYGGSLQETRHFEGRVERTIHHTRQVCRRTGGPDLVNPKPGTFSSVPLDYTDKGNIRGLGETTGILRLIVSCFTKDGTRERMVTDVDESRITSKLDRDPCLLPRRCLTDRGPLSDVGLPPVSSSSFH